MEFVRQFSERTYCSVKMLTFMSHFYNYSCLLPNALGHKFPASTFAWYAVHLLAAHPTPDTATSQGTRPSNLSGKATESVTNLRQLPRTKLSGFLSSTCAWASQWKWHTALGKCCKWYQLQSSLDKLQKICNLLLHLKPPACVTILIVIAHDYTFLCKCSLYWYAWPVGHPLKQLVPFSPQTVWFVLSL